MNTVPTNRLKVYINTIYSKTSSISIITTESFDGKRQMKKDKGDKFLKSWYKKSKQNTKLNDYSFITKPPDTIISLTIHRTHYTNITVDTPNDLTIS